MDAEEIDKYNLAKEYLKMHDPLEVVENHQRLVGIGRPYSHEKCSEEVYERRVLSYEQALEREKISV
jgi:hypothetical protein